MKLDSIILKVDLTTMNNEKPNQSILKKSFEIVVRKEYQQNDIFFDGFAWFEYKVSRWSFIKIELLTETEKPIYFSGVLLVNCLYKTRDSDIWQKTLLGITLVINVDILIKR